MTHPLIAQLLRADFGDSLGALSTPAGARRAIQTISEVRKITWAVRRGQITECMVRDFAAGVTAEYRRGTQLPGDLALAAMAVALEPCDQGFATKFLAGLASLKLAEMSVSIQVARECLRSHAVRPKNEVRKFQYPLCFVRPLRGCDQPETRETLTWRKLRGKSGRRQRSVNRPRRFMAGAV